ncbi:MAG TPA: hypothetical protein PK637_11030 [Flavobacteriales bacterium]|nr:hypothetical protein [Flavobacteriales bacterium]
MHFGLRNSILPLFLIMQTIYCWWCFYKAQFLAYDDNYGLLIHGFMISVVALIVICFLSYFKIQNVNINRYVIIPWCVFGSPFTLAISLLNYQAAFGVPLKY